MEFGIHRVVGKEYTFVRTDYPTAMRDYMLLFIPDEGCSLLIDGSLIEMEAYNLVLVAQDVQIKSNEDEIRPFFLIYFSEQFFSRTDADKAFLQNLKSFRRQEYSYRLLPVSPQYASYYEFIGLHLERAKQHYDEAIYRDLAHNMIKQIMLLAAIYLEENRSGGLLNQNADTRLIRRFQDLVSLHVKREKQVTYYADALCVSSKKLTELSKSVLGMRPKDVITEELIRSAKKLLAESSMSIKQIAWELGYTNENNFSSFFSKACGASPKAYRNRWQR